MSGAPTMPAAEYVLLDDASDAALARKVIRRSSASGGDGEPPMTPDARSHLPYAVLTFGAWNLGAFEKPVPCGALQLYRSAHAVALFNPVAVRTTWAYVSTDVEKLRWPSVHEVACAGGLVFLSRSVGSGPARELVVVEPTRATHGTLTGALEAWAVDGDAVRITEDGASRPIAIPVLADALR